MRTKVVFVGALPPPMGGAAKNNLMLLNAVQQHCDVILLNSAPVRLTHHKFHFSKLSRMVSLARDIATILRNWAILGRASVYLVPDGGLGALFQLPYLALLRSRSPRIMYHHRNYSYLDRHSIIHSLLWKLAPRNSLHVFLSPSMKTAYEQCYSKPSSTVIVSNLAFQDMPAIVHVFPRSSNWTLGHLSNLCQEKGIFDVINVFERLIGLGYPVRLDIAGPLIEPEASDALAALVDRYPDKVVYHGSLQGEAKANFYHMIDVFLFPTRFAKEAMPNVILESLSAGTFVIAYARGCIPELFGAEDGVLVGIDQDFGAAAIDWFANSDLVGHRASRSERRLRFQALTAAAKHDFVGLVGIVTQRGTSQEQPSGQR